MAKNPHLKTTLRNAMLDQINSAIGAGGFLRIYDGTQPATADTAITTQNLLASLPLSATPFGTAASGVATANAITDDSSADATGTATWGSFVTSAGVRVIDGSAGTSAADIVLNTVSIVTGGVVSCSSATVSIAA